MMNPRKLLFFASLIILSAGCEREKITPGEIVQLHDVVFHAGWEPEAKTVLQEDGSVWWSPGDSISLFVGSGENGGYKLTSTNSEPAAHTDFVGQIGGSGSTYIAIYPFNNRNRFNEGKNSIRFTIPTEQIAKEGTFAEGALVSVAVSSTETLYFKNLCSGIKFSVANNNINKVIIKARDNRCGMAGLVSNVTLTDSGEPSSDLLGSSSSVAILAPDGGCFKPGSYYYASVTPGTKSGGVVIEYYTTDKKVGTAVLDNDVTFNRAIVKHLYGKDEDLLFYPYYENKVNLYAYALLPDGVDKTKITDVSFFVNSDKTTNYQIFTDSSVPIYFELDGTTAKYYTNAEVYDLISAEGMFHSWTALVSVDLSHIITDKVESFSSMFYDCRNLLELDVSKFNTANCKDFSSMFYNCSSLQALDVTGFDTSKAEYLFWMFEGCKNLRSIDVRGFDTKNVTRMEGIFGGCASLTELDLSSFDFRSVNGLKLFEGCSNLVHIDADFSTADPSKLLYLSGMFEGCKKLESVDLTGLRTDNVIWMNAMFRQCVSLKSVDLSGFNTANVQLMDMMFESCCSLTSIDLSSFNTGSVTDMSFMFDGCSSLKRMDLSHFDTRNVTNMSCMFRNCMSLADLDISGFNAASLTTATEMFCFDFRLASLNLGSFDLSGADITTSGSLTGRDSECCNVKCSAVTRNALISNSGGFTSDTFIWYGENDEMPAYQETIDPNLYYSSDYSKDGTTKTIQTASSGAGVDIVLMGDAYSDRLIADGTYDNDMQKVIDAIFSFEPYKSLKELFNVYIVYAVSENEVIGKSTAFATYDGRSGYGAIGTADSWRQEVYTRKATTKIDFREVTPIIVLNSPVSDGAVWTILGHAEDNYLNDPNWDDYHGGESVVYVSGPSNSDFEYTVRHECGHALGQLADEYVTTNQEIDPYSKQQLQWGMNYGQWKNIDFTNDRDSVKWKAFILDSRYSNSRIDVYEGGANYFALGVWRPTENSIMNSDGNGQYNAPSREAIYYRINKIAYGGSWQYDYETFVQQDLKNIPPEEQIQSSAKFVPYPARVARKHIFKIDESTTADGKKEVTVIMN